MAPRSHSRVSETRKTQGLTANLSSPLQALAGIILPSLSGVLKFNYAQVLICPGLEAKHCAALITQSAGVVILMRARAAPGSVMKGQAAGKLLLL